MYVMGLDLGQAQDPTALCIVECNGTPQSVEVPYERFSKMLGGRAWTTRKETYEGLPATFAVRHLERLPLGTSYPDIADGVLRLLGEMAEPCPLAVDATGVGMPVVDMLRQMGIPLLVPIIITGGDSVGAHDDGTLTVPKADLVATVAVALQAGRLKVAASLALAEVLAQELQSFEVRITPSARATYGARSGAHDDLVLAVALACWLAEAWYSRDQFFPVIQERGDRGY